MARPVPPLSVVVLLLAALVTALAVAAAVVFLRNPGADAVRLQGEPMTDAAAAGQVVAAAKQIVSIAALHGATGGYAFMSCKNKTEPPYQVALHMTFGLPHSNSVKYLRDTGAAMVSHGWTRAPTTDEHFGQKLTKDGVTAIFYGSDDDTDVATMRLYGECRVTADHRNDNPVWTDLAGQLE